MISDNARVTLTKMVAKRSRTIKKAAARKRARNVSRGAYAGPFRAVAAPAPGELKFFDTSTALTTTATAGAILLDTLCAIPQGVTESTRVGRKCVLKSISCKIHLESPITANLVNSDLVRIIIYWDKQTNGATAAVTDILETADLFSFRNLSNSGRFRCLHDETYSLNPPRGAGDGATNDSGDYREYHAFNKRCNIPLEFSGSTPSIADLRTNNIGFLVISEAALSRVGFTSRVRFSDG